MTTLQKSGLTQFQSQRQLFESYKIKNINLKHRQYSSSKLMKTMLNQSKSQNFIEKNSCSQAVQNALEKKQLKKYCINKFKSSKEQQKTIIKRKNSSLKLFKRDDSLKQILYSKAEQIKSHEVIPSKKQERASASLSKQTASHQSIPVKRRLELMRLNKNYKLKLQRDENLDKHIDKGEVSFEHDLYRHDHQQGKILSNEVIRSENLLGSGLSGLRKSSSNKIKVLVKNPFQKHIKQQQALQDLLKLAANSSLDEFKESQIIQKQQSKYLDSEDRKQQVQQLQQLLAMI